MHNSSRSHKSLHMTFEADGDHLNIHSQRGTPYLADGLARVHPDGLGAAKLHAGDDAM